MQYTFTCCRVGARDPFYVSRADLVEGGVIKRRYFVPFSTAPLGARVLIASISFGVSFGSRGDQFPRPVLLTTPKLKEGSAYGDKSQS